MTCIDAFKNINISVPYNQLKVSPCCVTPTISTDTIDFYNNSYLNRVREQWSAGQWPQECKICKVHEDNNITSRRQGSEQWYKDHGLDNTEVDLVRIDYWVGDLCNLACVICSPAQSSAWKEELKWPIEHKKSSVNKFWKNLDLSTLRFIHFNGGEPLLSKEHVEFLEHIPNKQQVEITYNTNGTVRASDYLLSLWEQFRLVHLDFSIDDIEQRFEYQRYPAKWDQVTHNLSWYISTAPHNTMFGINTTVSWLNQKSIPKLSEWLRMNFYVTRFTDAIQHRQQYAVGKFGLNNDLVQIRHQLDEIDARRGTDWRTTFPELAVA
jgi:molybdenum cofactor biosynthesis enzyme MoaA